MLWIDVKYANMISNRLGRYSLKNNKPFLANFRCHYCGDSAKNKGKSRGYLIEKGGADFLIYFCHNCGKSTAFGRALKDIDPILYRLHRSCCTERIFPSALRSLRFFAL